MKDILTIALPVYKRTDYIRSALDSAVKQTIPCRILLIDNNSPHDDFKKIIDTYNNPLMKYVKTKETVPQDENFNNCFRYADTPFVTVLHDDDMLHIQFAEMTKKIFDTYGDRAGGLVVKSQVGEEEWQGIFEKTELTDDIKLVKKQFFYFSQLTPFPGVVVNKDLALEIGGFRSGLHPIADLDFWYRYCTSAKVLMVNQKLAYYRISPTQSTNHLIDDMINNAYEFKIKIIEEDKSDHILTRLALEQMRLININFFKRTYPNIQITEKIINEKGLRKAERLLRFKVISKLVQIYRMKVSFGIL